MKEESHERTATRSTDTVYCPDHRGVRPRPGPSRMESQNHGHLCGACHAEVNENGVPLIAADLDFKGMLLGTDYNLAVEFIHAEAEDAQGAGGTPIAAQ